MLYYRRSRFLHQVVLPLLLGAAFSACATRTWNTTWEGESAVEIDRIADPPSPARFTLRDSSTIELVYSHVERDSIIGTLLVDGTITDRRGAVALDDVVRIEQGGVNLFLLAGLLLGSVAIVYGIILLTLPETGFN
jgi:hypothetical protein